MFAVSSWDPTDPPSLEQAQDTIPICPAVISQKAAMGALAAGRTWVKDQVSGLSENKAAIREALQESLGSGSVLGGSVAIYFMARFRTRPHRLQR